MLKTGLNIEKMKELLNENDINFRLDKLAAFIEEDCQKLGGGITFICVLNGGFMFRNI